MEEPRASDLRRDGRLAMDLPLDRDPTATVKSGFSLSSRESGASDLQSDGVGDAWKNTTIAVRSNRDRAAIVDPSAWNLFHDHRSAVPENLEHDRRPIVVNRGRSREDRGLF